MGVPRHHLFKRVIQRCSKVNMNILKINTAYLIKYYMDIDVAPELKRLILSFSGHIRVGSRAITWVHY
jgi:hypothetical protein